MNYYLKLSISLKQNKVQKIATIKQSEEFEKGGCGKLDPLFPEKVAIYLEILNMWPPPPCKNLKN